MDFEKKKKKKINQKRLIFWELDDAPSCLGDSAKNISSKPLSQVVGKNVFS